jgi:hypothetical protein
MEIKDMERCAGRIGNRKEIIIGKEIHALCYASMGSMR